MIDDAKSTAKPKRKGVSKKTRFEVFKRDSFKCVYCGAAAPHVVLVLDHIEPVAKGGINNLLNYATSCVDCNAGKSDRRLSDDSVVSKRRLQSDMEAEAREQALAALEWQRSLIDRRAEVAQKVFEPLLEPYGHSLNERGVKNAQKLIDEVGIAHVVQAVQELCSSDRTGTPAQISDEIWEAIQNVHKRARWAFACEQEPNLREAAKIRSMLTYKHRYWKQHERATALRLIKRMLDAGCEPEELRDYLSSFRSSWEINVGLTDLVAKWGA